MSAGYMLVTVLRFTIERSKLQSVRAGETDKNNTRLLGEDACLMIMISRFSGPLTAGHGINLSYSNSHRMKCVLFREILINAESQ